ncbi:MAG TPA: UDP-N-acetylmuramoyl-tripeptide--D-alanyl-D-alanine ligase [Rhodocyclaceae bacterium]|nr:UDP-N-acetylmuramoyl-tripeptide--D-alanyl-D-alanine ligase [Rhodocyclaceae bacterium]
MLSMQKTIDALAGHGLKVVGMPAEYTAVSTDSRSIKPGEMFIALRGENFDGHAFVRDVLQKQAACALVDHAWLAENPNEDLPLLVVDETRAAFASLAAAWRATFTIPLIGVVGSNGKTTVKEMIASILAAEFGAESRLATTGNLNNDIGVPTMLLRLKPEHKAAVIEMGMNHPGETAVLARTAQATVAIINNAQREHQEFMKTIAAVAEEHAAVITALPASGVAVLNADDEFFLDWLRASGQRKILSFGFNAEADVRCAATDNGSVLHLQTPMGAAEIQLATIGTHNLRNALGAAAAALAAGCSLDAIATGLAAFRPVKGRLQTHTGLHDCTVIDDTYNANPDSVRAAIDVLAAVPGRRVLVLGDMGEVGDQGGQYHDEIGGYAKSQGVDVLLALGEMSIATTYNFGLGSLHFDSVEKLVHELKPLLNSKTTVLIKGSRFMRMERVVEAIIDKPRGHHAA